MRRIDLVGRKFGRLLVLSREESASRWDTRWLCKCDCGNSKVVASKLLRYGKTTSCGCFQIENTVRRHTKHGMCRSPEYRTWCHIIERCYNVNDKSFPNYGGRGIKMCPEWRASFNVFYRDMGSRPDPKASIERIDNSGDYTPANCKWATRKEQSLNRRSVIIIEHEGTKMCLSDWARHLGIKRETLAFHIQEKGRTLAEALRHIRVFK